MEVWVGYERNISRRNHERLCSFKYTKCELILSTTSHWFDIKEIEVCDKSMLCSNKTLTYKNYHDLIDKVL